MLFPSSPDTCAFQAISIPSPLGIWAQVAFGVYLNAATAFRDVFVKEQPSLTQCIE